MCLFCGNAGFGGGSARFFRGSAGCRRRGISLSIRERESDEEATAMQQYASFEEAPATIGDLVKEQMDRS